MAGALPKIAIGPRLREYKIKKEWPAIVGKRVAEKTKPRALIKGTLYCVVTSSAWMTELNYQRPLIIEKINEVLESSMVKAIVFKPGVLPESITAPPPAPPKKCSLTDSYIEETASRIKDDSLRELVSRVMKKYPF